MFDRLKKLFSRKPQAPRKPTTFLILPMVRILSAREQMNGVMMGRSSSVFRDIQSVMRSSRRDGQVLSRSNLQNSERVAHEGRLRIIEVFER